MHAAGGVMAGERGVAAFAELGEEQALDRHGIGGGGAAGGDELRGNVDTRLKKLANGDADASYLAASGLNRLGIKAWPGLSLEPVALTDMVPAAGQGAVAIQSRSAEVARYVAAGCAATTYSVTVERLFLAKLGEGCHTAFACHHAAGRVHLFRADFGRRDFAFPVTDLAAASALADDILRQILPR